MQNKYDQPGESSQYTKTAHNWWRLQAVHALKEWLKVYSNYSLCTLEDNDKWYLIADILKNLTTISRKSFFNWAYIRSLSIDTDIHPS